MQTLRGQVEFSLLNESIKSIHEVWDIQIENSMLVNQNTFFVVTIRENSTLIYEARSKLFLLNSGTQYFNLAMLQPLQMKVDMLNTAPLENRSLDVLIKLFNVSNELIAEYRIIKKSIGVDNESSAREKLKPKKLFSGNARVSGQFSDRQGFNSKVPKNFVRAECYPNLSVASIPVGMDILLSTEQSAQKQSLNQIALRFDAGNFKNNMQNLLKTKIKDIESGTDLAELQRLSDLKASAISKKFPKLKEWEKQLDDPEIKNSAEKLKELNRINSVLANPDIRKNRNRLKQLKNSKDKLNEGEELELNSLIQFDSEIFNLEQRVMVLEKSKQLGNKYEKLATKIKSAKEFNKNPILRDPHSIQKGLSEFNLMNKWQKILNGFENLTFGNFFPYYSKLTLNSLAINGVHVQYNPGKFYIETNYGQSARKALNTSYSVPQLTLPQTTFALKTGIGSKQGNHLHLCFIDIKDQLPKGVVTTTSPLNQNRIIGSEGRLSLFKEHINLGGEIVGSLFTRDLSLNSNNSTEYNSNTIPLKFLFPQHMNSSSIFDYAYNMYAKIKLFSNSTDINLNHERIGPNFINLGSPTLIRNIIRWKAELRQSFWEKKIAFSIFAKEDNNSLNPLLSTVRSNTRFFGLNCNLYIPKWPVFILSYTPYSQDNKLISGSQNFELDNRSWNVMLNYPIKITSNILSNTSIQFVQQSQNSNIPGVAYKYQMLGINQALQLRQGGISMALTYIPEQIINNVSQKLFTLDGNGSIFLFEKWNNQFGIQYLDLESSENRVGFYWNTEYLVLKNLTIEVRLQRNIYKNIDSTKEFMDYYGIGGIKYSW